MTEGFLKKNWEKKNDMQLRYVLQHPHQFSPQEVETAKEILEERHDAAIPFVNSKKEIKEKPPLSFYKTPIKPKYSLRAIAAYQVLTSLTAIPQFIFVNAELTLIQGISLAFILLLYLATLVSAILIYQKKQMGLLLGLVTNIIQAIQIHAAGIIFFTTGFIYAYFSIGTYTGFSVGFIPSSLINFDAQTDPAYIGLNVISIIAIVLLYRASVYCDENEEFPLHLY